MSAESNGNLVHVIDVEESQNKNWQYTLVEVEPDILDEVLEQLKGVVSENTSIQAQISGRCFLKSPSPLLGPPSPFESETKFVALPQNPPICLCTDQRVLDLEPRHLEHLSHLVVRPQIGFAPVKSLPMFLPSGPVSHDGPPPEEARSAEYASPYYMLHTVRDTLLGAVVPADYNLLFHFIRDETQRRFADFVMQKEMGTAVEFQGFTLKELQNTNLRAPIKAADDGMFHIYPLICLPRKLKYTDYMVLPLDEEADIANIAIKFYPLLEAHIKKVFEDSGRETVSEFSFFTALYILGVAVDEAEFAFSCLTSAATDESQFHNLEKSFTKETRNGVSFPDNETSPVGQWAQKLTLEWIRDPFVACQVLRFLVTSVRTGFDHIIPGVVGKENKFATTLSALETTCRDMSITQRTGYRMAISELKVYHLIAFLKKGSQPISPYTLMTYSHNNHINQNKLSPAMLYPFQSKVKLRIAPLKTAMQECRKTFSSLFQYYRDPDLFEALTNARNKITAGTISETWYSWNWNLGMFGEATRAIITGQVGLKQFSEQTGYADKESAMYMTLLGGKAFTIDLPKSVALTGSAEITPSFCTETEAKLETETFIVLCDSRELAWNPETRLKDLYRLKRFWLLSELREYIGPLLEHGTSLTLDKIIATYLEPHPYMVHHYQNASLHLERP